MRELSKDPGFSLKNFTYSLTVVSGGITHLVSEFVMSASLSSTIGIIGSGSSIFDCPLLKVLPAFFLSSFTTGFSKGVNLFYLGV